MIHLIEEMQELKLYCDKVVLNYELRIPDFLNNLMDV